MQSMTGVAEDSIRFYCKLEDDNAVKDYLKGGRCYRFTGVKSSDWDAVSLRQGVTVYVIDVDYWNSSEGNQVSYVNRAGGTGIVDYNTSTWILLEFTPGKGRNYYYPAFSSPSESKPVMGAILWHWKPFLGPALPAPPEVSDIAWPRDDKSQAYDFHSFHVGQGMAALIDNGQSGVMLDAGAGCPIKRPDYPDLVTNDLKTIIAPLRKVIMILSHPDLDHWRLLKWDPDLTKQLETIYVPLNTKHLVFLDAAVSGKIKVFTGQLLVLNQNSSLDIYRSQPHHSDQNGECQVCIFNKGNDSVLVPGDYVYERIVTDDNKLIANLMNTSYSAIIVPHHGDHASSYKVFNPRNPQSSIAFFSAGTHRGYNHPTPASVDAHKLKGFKVISNRAVDNIVKQKLC
ncbi:hypothetical protein [Pseudomonas viridiflava]|uniref:hypothetical protein n=1 Tax=Pseudomonas viridiflava TaxID=33069 RepID=UPI002EBB5F0F|nr:hypothetical protein [Pseudomonas viridiflava]